MESSNRHPKIGKHVLIGAGTQILGNITVGNRVKIGAGSVVFHPIPRGMTAVGAPAKIIGFTARGKQPGCIVDMNLVGVELLLGDKIHANRLLKLETTIDSSSTGKMTEKDHSLETKLEGTNGGHVGDFKKSMSKEDKIDRGSSKEEADENATDSSRSLCPFSESFPAIPCSVKNKCISHKQLCELPTQEGYSKGECMEIYFKMLQCTPALSHFWPHGCIPLEIFSHCFTKIAKEKTRLDADRVQALQEGGIRKLGLSKKGSMCFKSTLNRHTVVWVDAKR
jgi:hypothetical protein